MNLAKLPPLGLKVGRAKPNPFYIAAIHTLPCCVCEAFGEIQRTPTQAHHVCHGRFSGRKTPDEMAIPLCMAHHVGTNLDDKLALHQAKDEWLKRYGPDHQFTAATQDKLAEFLGAP